jgi:hypothetical protein
MHYPKWIYHAKHEPKVVESAEEHEAAGPGWAESPDEAKAYGAQSGAEDEPELSPEELEAKAKADAEAAEAKAKAAAEKQAAKEAKAKKKASA